MKGETIHERVGRLSRKSGPQIERYCEFLATTFYETTRKTGLELGFSAYEAEAIAATATAGALKSFSSAKDNALLERRFAGMRKG